MLLIHRRQPIVTMNRVMADAHLTAADVLRGRS